jgi:hypothetical protein
MKELTARKIDFRIITDLWIKIIPFFLVWSLRFYVPITHYRHLVLTIGITHYLVSAFYSRQAIFKYFELKNTLRLLFLTTFTALSSVFRWPPIYFYFGLHHVFSEVYSVPESYHLSLRPLTRSLRLLFHSLCYFMFIKETYAYNISPEILNSIPLWTSLVFIWIIISELKLENLEVTHGLISVLAHDALLGLVVLMRGLVPSFRLYFEDVLLYHFVYWTFLPLSLWKLKIGSVSSPTFKKQVISYGALSLGIGLLVSCLFNDWLYLSQARQAQNHHLGFTLFYLLGYVHIGVSFGLSRHNPKWLYHRISPRHS